MATGEDRLLVRGIEHDLQLQPGNLLDVLPNYSFSPDDKSVYLACEGKIHRVQISDGKVCEIPFEVKTTLEIGPENRPKLPVLEHQMPIRMFHWQALRCATLMSADALGMSDDLGSLEKGKLADLLILNANPLESIQNIIKLAQVMQAGFLYNAGTPDEIWPQRTQVPAALD